MPHASKLVVKDTPQSSGGERLSLQLSPSHPSSSKAHLGFLMMGKLPYESGKARTFSSKEAEMERGLGENEGKK